MTQTQQKKNTSKTTSAKKRVPRVAAPFEPKLPQNSFLYEILELASKQRTNVKKEEVLRVNRNNALIGIVIWNFDNSIMSLLPPGEVPYMDFNDMVINKGGLDKKIESDVKYGTDGYYTGLSENDTVEKTTLNAQAETLQYFVAGKRSGPMGRMTKTGRENLFLKLLYGLHQKEAQILCYVKDKKLTDLYKISYENVKNAFPDIVWDAR